MKPAKVAWLGESAPNRAKLRHAGTRNVGWLEPDHEFSAQPPTDDVLDRLWKHCKVAVNQTRGIHSCEFCTDKESNRAERHGEKATLGSAEIRVFSQTGIAYAAPNLIYHYVLTHHYCPPDEFLQAVTEGPCPPDQEYFGRLAKFGLEWNKVMDR